jgi:hypothetical protein
MLTRKFIGVLITGVTVGVQLEEVFWFSLLGSCIEIGCVEGTIHCAEVVRQVVYRWRLRWENGVGVGGETEMTQQVRAFERVFTLDGV